MPAGLRHVVPAAAAAFLIVLAAPAAAIAGGGGGAKCNASACKVYVEQNVPHAGGQQQQAQQPTGSATNEGNQPKNVARVLALAGADKGPLSRLLTDSGLGTLKSGAVNVVAPSALGAAFDLGAGPTALFAILLAAALGFGVHGGVHGWLRRRSSA